jgi:predicted small lipoprotein YifL
MTKMKNSLSAVLALLLCVLLTACGGAGGAKKAEVDISAKRAEVKLENDKGKVVIDTEGAELPEDWPADIPMFPKAKVTSVVEGEGDAEMMMAVCNTGKDVASIKTYYEKQLPENGWSIENKVESGTATAMLMAVKDAMAASISVNKNANAAGSVITVTLTPR